ncbi:Uncharacterized protein Rs2_30456 [Raphanus sativus]|uniref:Uncharacterized protein LOC108812832 n=1 Tax=Raphanus sativus TaxID=3726 RepID=A0A6J0K162_RAPSA|nr:uncharacterized protein LOC108812832 [Raphanus sativus]KAJ4890708.1 Uncharacterized protein Rs2_30456 [Raphanus sativus]
MKSRNLRPVSKLPVKLEIVEDFLEEENGPAHKRSKLWSNGTSVPQNLIDEPSPLGLSLRKSPSLQDLIQMRLSQSVKKETIANASSSSSSPSLVGTVEKLKASNFPATLLRIGQWEYKSRYEGDLVAKCYFAKHKLVWEVLEQGLKSKIEIQWSDIMGLKASCPEDAPGTLTIVLARRPLFFRETNPQPRKHTLWQATSDFTDGQASMNRQHFLQCAPGILNKHIEKLLQCDHRLFCLSREPSEIHFDSLFFDTRQSIFEDPSVSGGSQNIASSPVGAQSSSEHMSLSHDALSPSSVMDARAIEGRTWNQIQVPPGLLHQSISMNDFLALLSDQANCEGSPEFEDMKQLLLSDTHPETSDEKSVMSKVNSFYNLLQTAAANDGKEMGLDNSDKRHKNTEEGSRVVVDHGSSSKPQGMSRKDSFSDLLAHLPRITSLPKFLFDISEEDG